MPCRADRTIWFTEKWLDGYIAEAERRGDAELLRRALDTKAAAYAGRPLGGFRCRLAEAEVSYPRWCFNVVV